MAHYRKTSARIASSNQSASGQSYDRFDKIDGRHPLRNDVQECVVDYPARIRPGGSLRFFNFSLAKEMGLIGKDHPEVMNTRLEKKILDTFGIIIINEYDEINGRKFPKEDIKPYKYMATRYLQLQHPNKQGKTSGDGRSIWNGTIKHKGRRWDISSCGTGATCLSPATAINKKYYQSGDPSISYGCGYSEVDEGISTAFFSEVLYRNNIPTERVLAVLEYPKGMSINVRAHDNLIRPSHCFRYLKLEDHKNATALLDYYIDRQVANGTWGNAPEKGAARYRYFLEKLTERFAHAAAMFEDEYIFCWLDWDGDNILMDGSILDYGSVRQFGLFHHEYRYDDDDRYSTTLTEQKSKARYTIQTFAQLVDFVITGRKKTIGRFNKHATLKYFDQLFLENKDKNILAKIGFKSADVEFLFSKHRKLVQKFRSDFSYFERAKSVLGIHQVPDGINWNAIFCMRDILRELPQLLLSREEYLSAEEFINIIKSRYAVEEDLVIQAYRRRKSQSFQKNYRKMFHLVAQNRKERLTQVLLEASMRSSVINKYDRVTGDSISTITDRILSRKPKLNATEMYELLDEFCHFQLLDPDQKLSDGKHSVKKKILKGIIDIVRDYREGI